MATLQEAHEDVDFGLFGPGSVTWRVHTAMGPMLVGGIRALIVQSLHPHAMAGVAQHSDYRTRGLHRLRRTAEYVAAVGLGTTAQAYDAADRVKNVHTRVRGIDPITGRPYSAGDPETLLWVHCAEVHSFLAAHRAFVGTLSPEEEDRYLAEQVRAAMLLDIPEDRVPASRAEMRSYFEGIRPHLCVSEAAREAISFVLDPPLTRELLTIQVPMRLLAQGALAIVPRHLRRLIGVDRPAAVDAAVITATRPAVLAAGAPVARIYTRHAIGASAARYGFEARQYLKNAA